MSDDFCRAVRQALPDIAQSVVTAMEDELADCRTRLAEVEAENGRLREVLGPFSDMAGEMFARNWERGRVAIALDNPGDPHRLTFDDFLAVRAALTQTTEKDHD